VCPQLCEAESSPTISEKVWRYRASELSAWLVPHLSDQNKPVFSKQREQEPVRMDAELCALLLDWRGRCPYNRAHRIRELEGITGAEKHV